MPPDCDGDAADPRQRRREEILAAAATVFADRGYHKASINEIIARAGIARGTFYLYFEGKHAVLDAILDHALTALRGRIQGIDVGPTAPPPQEQLRQNVLRVLRFVISEPAIITLVLQHGLAPDDGVAAQVSGFYGHALEQIQLSLQAGIALGVVRPCNVEVVAAATLGAVRGVIVHVLTQEEPDLDEITEDVLAFALQGVVPHSSDTP